MYTKPNILTYDRSIHDIISLSLNTSNVLEGEELNGYGGVYVKRNPQLKIKVVDGSSLAAAIVLNSIPKGTTQVLLRGKITKVACAIAVDLCKQGIQVCLIPHIHVVIGPVLIIGTLF